MPRVGETFIRPIEARPKGIFSCCLFCASARLGMGKGGWLRGSMEYCDATWPKKKKNLAKKKGSAICCFMRKVTNIANTPRSPFEANIDIYTNIYIYIHMLAIYCLCI